MYILILLLSVNGSSTAISSLSQEFESEAGCLKAISKVMDFEPKFKVRAVCVKK